MEDFRFTDLDQVGISFIPTSPFKEDMIFPEFENNFELVKHDAWQEENGIKFRYEIWARK